MGALVTGAEGSLLVEQPGENLARRPDGAVAHHLDGHAEFRLACGEGEVALGAGADDALDVLVRGVVAEDDELELRTDLAEGGDEFEEVVGALGVDEDEARGWSRPGRRGWRAGRSQVALLRGRWP